ncbi:hypothetical protein L7F22_037329 [Adiantum nelumboides]|nr:hypothetical protein [Adiantum nelumboides]
MAVVGDSSIYRSSFSSLQAQHASKERRFASLSPFFRIPAEFWTPALSRLTIKPSSRYHFSCQSGREPHSWHVLGLGLVSGIQARCSAQSDCFHGIPFHQDPHTSFGTVSLKMTTSLAPLNFQRILCNRNSCNRQTKRFQGSTVVACVPGDGTSVGITLGLGEKNGHSGLSGNCADSALPIDNSAVSDSSVNASGGDEASVEHLKGVLQSALEELDLARLNSSKIEEDAQAITERAIALRDKAVTAEAKAENAAATVTKIQNEELGLEGRLSKERVALAEAEARVLLAEKALSQTKQAASSSLPDFTQVGPQDIVENTSSFVLRDSSAEVEALASASVANDVSDNSISETSTLSKEEEELAAAEAELKACRVAVTQYETELMRLTNSKLDMQREAIGLVEAAKVARASAIAADEEVTQVMSLAEQAVAVEVDAAQKVCIAEVALQKAEKLASEELHSDATVASTQAESVGNTGDALQGESAVEAGTFAARGTTDGHEVEALEKVPELEQIKPFAGSFEAAEIIDDTVKRISVALKVEDVFQEPEVEKVKSEKQQKEVVKEAPSAAVPKSSTKRSSRFFSASYFSFKDDEEFTPTSDFQGIREHFVKVSVGVLLLCGGSLLLKNRMESQPQLLERTEFVSEVTSSAKPFEKELRRLPRRLQKMLEKIPHQEENFLTRGTILEEFTVLGTQKDSSLSLESVRPGPLEVDILLIQNNKRKGPVFIGRDTPTLRTFFSPRNRFITSWTEDAVVFQLMNTIEDLLASIGVMIEDIEELVEMTEDSMGRLVWLLASGSWCVPHTFRMGLDWPHPPSVVMWMIRETAAILGMEEDILKSWTHFMIRGICKGYTVPWC